MYFVEQPITRCKATNENDMLRSGEEFVNNTTLYGQDMTNRNLFMGVLSLIQHCLDNAIHRRFKERSNISPR